MPSAATRPISDSVRRLGLGTVQFGQAYGVSNTAGQVPLAEVRAMLARAAGAGVAVLDTAANYGQAEGVLAQCDTSAFRIVSKTVSAKNGVATVTDRARQSVQSLGRVDVLLVHAAADLLGPCGDELWRALRTLKEGGAVGAIGISAYVADDPAALAHRFRPDVMVRGVLPVEETRTTTIGQHLVGGSLAQLKDGGHDGESVTSSTRSRTSHHHGSAAATRAARNASALPNCSL